jgi:hypothetical protein
MEEAMREKLLSTGERVEGYADTGDDAMTELARGSKSNVTSEHVAHISQPRLPSRAPLSAFQLSEVQRQSEPNMMVPQPMPSSGHAYLIAIVALLFCTIGVLVYLLVA